MNKTKDCLRDYLKICLPLAVVFYLLRFYEYFTSGIKLATNHNFFVIIVKWLFFDTYTWLVYIAILFIPFLLLYLIHKNIGRYFLLIVNGLTILGFFGLLVVFSERLVPFDHELFVRKASESFSVVENTFTGRFLFISPIFIYIIVYVILYKSKLLQKSSKTVFSLTIAVLSVCSLLIFCITKPSTKKYSQVQDYYLVSNKLQYFIADSYAFLFKNVKIDFNKTNKEDIAKEIDFYENSHEHHYVDKEYPLLYMDEPKNVLKDFFRQSDTVPNIVILIVEGLSRDFSGDDANAGSFTPFLDSLASNSLSWYNALSSAQGTFGSAPSILGSLPFGERGFSLLMVPPEHISLIKILKRNNWQSYYFTGADLNFDNFGSFLRLQGTSYILTRFGPKYKRMGLDKDGMSTGYPDDALFERSLQVLDSIHKTPYLSVYLTVTTHSPYIFAQSKQYEKLFEKVLESRKLSESRKRYLRMYKPLWASFLFTDNCLRNFFASYRKRKEYKNTIFIITGDHHHGFYPTRNEIDDYNVPLIIYSPLLKKAVKFNSVNSHLNITPTVLSYLKNSYHLKYYPRYVPWLADELDTCRTFRNIHQIPFMLTNRDINDYLDNNYYIGGNQLYKLTPGLNLVPIENDEGWSRMNKLRENFKFINSYVCQNNKLFPSSENIFETKAQELQTFTIPAEHEIPQHEIYQYLITHYQPPSNIKKIVIEVSFSLMFDSAQLELLPHLFTFINSADNQRELLASSKNIYEFVRIPKKKGEWSVYKDEDMFDFSNYPDPKGHILKVAFFNHDEIKMKIKDLTIKFLGIK